MFSMLKRNVVNMGVMAVLGRRNKKIRDVAKNLILTFVHHVRDRVNARDFRYLATGIDRDFLRYVELYQCVARKFLGLAPLKEYDFSVELIDDILGVLKKKVSVGKLGESPILAECIYDVGLYVLQKVKEEEFEELDDIWRRELNGVYV